MKSILLSITLYFIIAFAFGDHVEDSDYDNEDDIEYVSCEACPEDVLSKLNECAACPDDVLGYLKYEKKKCGANSCNVLDKLSECKVCPDEVLYRLNIIEYKIDELLSRPPCEEEEEEEEESKKSKKSKKKKSKKSKKSDGAGIGDCDCEGGMVELRLIYSGESEVDITFADKKGNAVCVVTDVDEGDEAICNVAGSGLDKFSSDTMVTVVGGTNDCETKIHTSCSRDIVGTSGEGDCGTTIIVSGWQDAEGGDCDDGVDPESEEPEYDDPYYKPRYNGYDNNNNNNNDNDYYYDDNDYYDDNNNNNDNY